MSATTTAASEGVSPESAVDGDDLTCWESSETVTEGRPQSLPVDLGKTYDIRNARVGMKYDYLLSSYTISTSADGNTWSEQVRNSKTAHSSNILDRFAAEGVRYVKVEFTDVKSTQGESGGSEPHAFITEFEVYQDKGVETVADYNLAGLDVAGEDLVFSASKTEYSLTEQGDGSEIFLRAYPANKNSQVSVNGTVLKTGAADSMEELSYIKAVPDAQGRITVEVVSFDGKGTKEYVLTTEAKEQGHTAWTDLVKGENGAKGWTYGTFNSDGTVRPFENRNGGYISGEYAFGSGNADEWLYAGPRFMHPAEGTEAVRSFTAPKTGWISLQMKAQKYANQPGDVSIRVLKNGAKIWPVDEAYAVVTKDQAKTYSRAMQVEEGDEIQIALGDKDGNGGDATYIESTIKYTENEKNVTYLSDLEWESATAGWGTVRRDVSTDGNGLRLTGGDNQPVSYEKGLGTHAQSEIVYDVKDKGYTRFQCYAGIDYEMYGSQWAGVVCKVYFDHKNTEPVYVSRELGNKTPQERIDIPINSDVRKVILVADKGEADSEDHVDWADAKFLSEANTTEADRQAAQAVMDRIDRIGTVQYDEASREKIEAAQAAYEALTETQKKLVSNRDKLEAAQAEYDRLEAEANATEADRQAAQAVIEQIKNLGTVTAGSKAAIEAARAAYEALTPEQKKLVGNLDALKEAEDAYRIIEDAAEKDRQEAENNRKAAQAVIDQIKALGSITTGSKAAIEAARAAYEALTPEQKKLVGNLGTLAEAESIYQKLEEEADKAQQSGRITKISLKSGTKGIAAGKKVTIQANVSVSGPGASRKLNWSSSNKKYATVSSTGVVTTKKAGAGKTVTITAAAADGSGKTGRVKIKIVKHAVKKISLKCAKKTVKAGRKITVKANVSTTGKKANRTLEWSVSNKKYAAVSKKGVVTTKKAGAGKTVKITAKATDGTGKKAAVRIRIKK